MTLWGRDAAQLAEIAAKKENTRYLPGVKLELSVEPDLERAVAGKPFVLTVVPSHTMREVMARAAHALRAARDRHHLGVEGHRERDAGHHGRSR